MSSPMAAGATQTAHEATEALHEARDRTLSLVASLSDPDLERVHSSLMSPLVWDLGHIAAFEDLWLAHRYGGLPLLRPDLLEVYDALETPRARRGDLPFLEAEPAREYLDAVRERTLAVTEAKGVGDGVLHELVLRHEHQHDETMLQTLQLAQLDSYEPPPLRELPEDGRTPASAVELVDVPGGPCTIGAAPEGFAYDNERPRFKAQVPAFRIGRTPVTNATYLRFVEGGGYVRREWWSDEGWSWKEQYDITRPGGWTPDCRREWRLNRFEPLHPRRPVVHVSWFEADAFARAHGARLPTEWEWEKAATWNQELGRAQLHPWGDEPPDVARHANLDQLGRGPAPVDSLPDGTSPFGCTAMVGDVWEWTASQFSAYPGFVPHPYREYSAPFFDSGYRVLRGGSWATRPRVATSTFRNWDHPQRRQIFSGLRIATDA